MSGFFCALVKAKELHVLKPAQLSDFGFPFPENAILFGFMVTHESVKTNFGVWSLARKLKILGRLRLFRLVVTGVGGLLLSCPKHYPCVSVSIHGPKPNFES